MIRIAILSFILFSCSANWHLNRAVKKGAELKTEVKHDTTFISESHYTIDTSTYTIVKYVPETRWKTRIEYKYDYKAFRDSLRHVKTLYRDSISLEKKRSLEELKNERKKNNLPTRIIRTLVIFFVLILIAYIVIRIILNKIL